MPTLSERDLGHIVKLFNAIRSVLEYDKAHRRHGDTTSASGRTSAAAGGGDASTSSAILSVAPSVVLREHHDLHGTTATLLTSSPTAGSAGGVSTVSERRLWTELAFLMWRVVAVQKLSLMSYVTSDPGLMLRELARALLAYLKESCAAAAGTGKTARMRHVAFLAQDRLLFLLRAFCSLKNCTVMLSDTSGRDNASAAQEVFDAICGYVVAGQHFVWMSQIYVWFCDEAARLSRCGGAVPSAYVYATHDALRCILGCCTDHEGCARAMLYSEPVACVSYMFYGLKLRISMGDPLRPYEDDHPLVDAAKLGLAGSGGGSPLDEPPAQPIPQRPAGARSLKTRYFTTLTTAANATTQPPSTTSSGARDGASAPGNASAILASLVPPVSPPTPGSPPSTALNTSWAFNLPDLSRQQLKAFLVGGRENAFDALLYSAMDVVVEAVRVTRDYGHWMVLSVTNNLLLLSKKCIELDAGGRPAGSTTASSPPSSFSAPAAAASAPPMPLSHVVAMYENITVLFQLLYSLMQGLDAEKHSARAAHGAGTTASTTTSTTPPTTIERGSRRGGGSGGSRGTPVVSGLTPPSGAASPPPQLRGATSGNSAAPLRLPSTPAALAAAGVAIDEAGGAAGPASRVDTAQLREDFSQHIVHMVLQTDVHAVVTATTRVLQCDRTLFRVLHAFCVLDAVPAKAPHAAKRRGDTTRASKPHGVSSMTVTDTTALYPRSGGSWGSVGNPHGAVMAAAGGGGVGGSGPGAGGSDSLGATVSGGGSTVPVFNAAASFFMTSNFGDLRHVVSDTGAGGDAGESGGGSSHNSSHAGGAGGGGGGAGSGRGSGLSGSGFMGGGAHPVMSASFSLTNNPNSASLTPNRPGQLRAVGRQTPGTQQRLRQRRRDGSSPGGDGGGGSGGKAGAAKGGGGGENFAKSFFKSFFGTRKPGGGGGGGAAGAAGGGGGGGTIVRGLTHGDSDGDDAAERDSWDGSSRSHSDASDSDSDGSVGSSDSDNASEGDDLMSCTMGTLTGSMAAAPSSPRVVGGIGGLVGPGFTSRQQRSGSRGAGSGTGGRRHRRRKTHAKKASSPWRDVPSYTALVSELVRIFNLVLGDGELSVDVRLGTGLLLPSIVLRDSQVFRLYEGRVLIRNYLNLLLHELQHNIRLRGAPSAPALAEGATTTTGAAPGGERDEQDGSQDRMQRSTAESAADASTSTPKGGLQRGSSSSVNGHVMSGRAHLTQRELIAFAPKVIEALEQTFKVLGVTPLTSDVASLTELPLYFFCADGVAPLGVALERSFTRVVVLWLIGLVGAQCDEDIDRHAMQVLLHLMSRAISRGSLPKDSSTTLMITPSGAATVVQISTTSGVAVPAGATLATTSSSADWASARRAAALLGAAVSGDVGSGYHSSPSGVLPAGLGTATSSGVLLGFAPSAALSSIDGSSSAGRGAAVGAAEVSGGQFADAAHDADLDLCRNHFNNSLFDAAEYVGLATAAGLDGGIAECGNTVEALGSVFRVLLGRTENLLSPAGLATVLSLFTSHDSNLSRLGRECMMRSLETPSVYPLYADVILDSETYLLTQTLSVLSAYLTSASLTSVTRRERRLWMQRCGCVDAVIRVLVRVLDSPQSTPTMKVIPHLFQFLSAFESGDHKPPQLSSTNFIASVTERLALLEGTEYFIIISQAALDASMGTYGGVEGGYTSAGGPGAHYAEMQVIGSFHVALYNCAAEKPIFLELLPSLLTFAERHSEALFANLVEVLYHVLECTSNVRSDRLADFILDHRLSQLLPFLELSGKYVEERLPFTGSAVDLHGFWHPILLRAPRRSKLRFTSHGGVQVSVGLWPETGFTISAWFKFDRLYTAIPLFEFYGVLGDSTGLSASPRGTSMSASLFVSGGDSVQLSINDGRRVTVNENQALQNFTAQTWLHVCAVLRTTHVLDFYVGGFKVGTAALPYFAGGTEVHVNVGCSEDAPHHAAALTTDAAPLFSLSDITLWSQALTRAQLEAELGEDNRGAVQAIGSGRHGALPVKILPESIPQELSLFRHMSTAGVGGAGAGGGGGAGGASMVNAASPGSTPNFSVLPGLTTRRSAKGLSAGPSIASAHSFTGATTGSIVVGDDDEWVGGSGGGWSASAARMARFVPYENEDNLLRNVVAYPAGFPVIAKLVGRYATPPKTWVDYPLLWATRGGLVRLLDWLHLVTSSAQLEGLLQLILECVKRTTLAVTLDPRTYVLFAYMLTHHVARYVTTTACDQLLTLASTHINVFDEEHRIIINRLAFEHILANVNFYAAVRLDTAVYLLQRVRRLFHTSQCRYARHNARFVSPYRFVDRLLHSLIGVAGQTPLLLRRAVVQVAQQVVVACDMEDGLVQIFIALVALLTPEETTSRSRRNEHVRVLLPAMVAITRGTAVPLRTANNLTTLFLSSLVECLPQSACVAALSRTVDLPWYAATVSRFADPASVVYATRIFFEAVQHNPALHEEVAQHQAAVVEALTEHAVHEDLILLLLALTMGATRHVDVLSRKHSLLQQLDSLLTTFSPEPNTIVAPIFVRLLVVHLHRVVQSPWRRLVKAQPVLHDEQRLSFRVRRYFSLARVCSRLMILIKVRRYRGLLVHGLHHHGPLHAGVAPANAATAHSGSMGGLPQAHYQPHHARVRSSGGGFGGSSTSRNASFALGGMGGAAAVARGSDAPLDNPSFASAGRLGFGASQLGPDAATAAAAALARGGDGYDDDPVYGAAVAMASAQSHSLREGHETGRSSAGGYVYGDEDELPLEKTPFEGMMGLHRQMGLPAALGDLGDDDTGGASSCGGGGGVGGGVDAPEWKPPVLLPDMWATLPPPLPAAAAAPAVTAVSSIPPTPSMGAAAAAAAGAAMVPGGSPSNSALYVASGGAVVSASGRTSEAPTTNVRSPVSSNVLQYPTHIFRGGSHDFVLGTGLDSGEISAQIRERPDARVRSHTHRRAFAVLRVCVLLWLPVQARRCRWVFTPHPQPYEDDFKQRHAGTLFCVRMLRHFAAMPPHFYLFVNSPLQTVALSSLVAYISRDMLLEQLDTWDQMIRSMTVAPARDADVPPVASAPLVAVPAPAPTEAATAAVPATTATTPTASSSAAAVAAATSASTNTSAVATPADSPTPLQPSAAASPPPPLEQRAAAVRGSSVASLSDNSDADDDGETKARRRGRLAEGGEDMVAGEGDRHADAAGTTPLDVSLRMRRGAAMRRGGRGDDEAEMESASLDPTLVTHTEPIDAHSLHSGDSDVDELDDPGSCSRARPARDARWGSSRATATVSSARRQPGAGPRAAAGRGVRFGSDAAATHDGAEDEVGDDEHTDPLPPPQVPATALRRLARPSSMTFRSAGSSSTQLDRLTALESPQPSFALDGEEADAVLNKGSSAASPASPQRQRRPVAGDEDIHSSGGGRRRRFLGQLSFDSTSAPPSTWATRLPAHRTAAPRPHPSPELPPQPPQHRITAPPTHPRADLHGRRSLTPADEEEEEGVRLDEAAGAAAAGPHARSAARTTAEDEGAEQQSRGRSAARSRRAGDAPAGHTHDDEDEEDGDDSSFVSSGATSVSSQGSVASTSSVAGSAPSLTSSLPSTAATASAPKSALPSFSNLPSATTTTATGTSILRGSGGFGSAGNGRDPSDLYAMSISKMVESVAEVVRRDTVGILRSLIRASLDTLPVPHWIGGPTYGSCGGLLFQLLFIVSAKPAADDSTTTLVRYFLLCVGNAVKELRDRDLVEPASYSHEHGTASPRRGRAGGAPLVPLAGLGGTGANSGGSPTASPPAPPRMGGGGSSFHDAPALGNASFAMPTALSAASSSAAARTPVAPLSPPQLGATTAGGYAPPTAAGGAAAGPLSPMGLMAGAAAVVGAHGHGGGAAGSGVYSDVFLFNVSHFTDLIVDMLAINVLDLPMATHYFLTLLVLCQGWPTRYVDQLSWQVMRACIAVLNRPSMQDASVGLIESIYTLSTLVLRRGWKHKGVLESLLRVLYKVYGALPPAWMPDADARHRKHLITLIFRHLVQTYAGTKELEKALTVRTLTQRLSVYDDFLMIFSLPDEAECCATFDEYCVGQFSSLETLMAGRLKAKADLAFKASIKTRSEYIKRIKAFNAQLVQTTEVAERYKRYALRTSYAARFSSYVAATPRVDASQLHWLLSSTCALRETHTARAAAAASGAVGGERELYHYMDPQMNYGKLKGVRWGEERASPSPAGADAEAAAGVPGGMAGGVHSPGTNSSSSSSSNNNSAPASHSRKGRSTAAAGRGKSDASATAADTDEHPPKNDLVRAAQCEETVQHIAVLVPPFSTRCRPHIGDDAFPTALKDLSITLTPSAMTLLRYLVSPHETLRFLSNGFRVNGIHATPCLILLTNVTLKVIGFSRVTEGGDIILCEHDEDNDDDGGDAHSRGGAASESSVYLNNSSSLGAGGATAAAAAAAAHHDAGSFAADGRGSPSYKPARRNPFSMASMTKQLQKLFYDDPAKRRQQQDGTRVAQAVRQVMGHNYQNIFWSYLVSSIRVVRSLHYMHLDTAVQLQLYHDNGPMLSVVDAKQSMNPSARKEFLKVLRDVVGPQQCAFVDDGQRAANMKAHLVRWATGSLSNYEYLRFLNEVAGRTNRDLNQYPVFPWVLADYTSATLDLESAVTFRNFGYPMGAQTETRRALVAQLFENSREVCDIDTGRSYPFHHGTHYSTSGGVLYFLLRAQPFTTYARLFQGGDFDLAMRLFDSVAASFTSCITGPADCKELIPEFYVNSGFLANADRLSLGVKSDGDPVDDVRLPPWAKNSRQVFTAVMRYALECPYVVEHLHQWIDLVFGVRRRGPLAMERYNVFQRMTYGEEVAQALKEAETPHDCDVIIAEVDNFGQTPPQLFQERHPSHHELAPVIKAGGGNDGGSSGGGSAGSSGSAGGMSRSDAHLASSAPASAVNSMSAVTLGGLYNSASAAVSSAAGAMGAGSQIGVTFSNLVSSGAFASGQTYTLAFRREAPKVLRMLIHAMDEVLTWYVLRDPPPAALQHPPPPALTEVFRFNSQAVLGFGSLRTPRRLACSYAQLVPVEDTDHYVCWHEREAQLMRYTAAGTQSAFLSAIAFEPPDESDSRISAVAVGPRESVLLIAISSGAVYCLFPDDAGTGALHVRVTLCYHRSAVTKIALDSVRHRAVTITRSASGDDDPVLWRVQRSGCSFVARLRLAPHAAATPTSPAALAGATPVSATTGNASAASPHANASGSPLSASVLDWAEPRTAVDVAVDSVTGNVALVTARSLILFDHNGEPFGAGTLPSPSSVRAVDTVTLEEENGDVGVVVGRTVPCVADMTAVVFYQAREWASGMGVLLTGHKDGSIAVWRTTRLPPDTVAPGRIAMVEFHARLVSGAAATTAAGAASAAAPMAAGGGAFASAGLGTPADLGARSGGAAQRGTPPVLGGPGAGGVTGTGSTNCAVTVLQQERADVPTFFVGYANGTVRQLVFEDPSLAAAGGGGGSGAAAGGDGGGGSAGKEGGGSASDDRASRR